MRKSDINFRKFNIIILQVLIYIKKKITKYFKLIYYTHYIDIDNIQDNNSEDIYSITIKALLYELWETKVFT